MRALHLASVTAALALATSGFALAGLPAHKSAPHRVAVKHRAVAHPAANYAGFIVPMDEARVIKFTKSVSTVFVGNTMIADVTMIDSHHAYVLGKVFGATNVIGLDSDHNQVVNEPVTVANRVMGEVTLTRGPDSYNYSCTQYHCETNPRPGDPQTYFKNTEEATQMHQDMATKAASLQSAPSGNTPQ
jgi:Flp pilus assembly secretin CpaC